MSIHELDRRLGTSSRFAEPKLRAPLPEPRDLGLMLSDVVRHTIRIQTGGVPDRPRVVAHYQGEGRAVACVADLGLALALGGAVREVPRGTVEELLAHRRFEGSPAEGAEHVFEALAAMLNWPGYTDVSLRAVYGPGSVLAPAARVPFAAPRDRVGLTVTVHGYGGGCLRFLTAWDPTL